MSETLPPSRDAYTVSSVEFPDDPEGYKKLYDEIAYTSPETEQQDEGQE